MKRIQWLLFSAGVLVVWVGLAWGQGAAAQSGMTPAGLQAWFDANKTMLNFVVGLLVKYVPFLSGVTNAVIPWLGTVLGILIDLFGPTQAHASTGTFVADAGSLVFRNFVQAVWARQVYESLGRPILERLFTKR